MARAFNGTTDKIRTALGALNVPWGSPFLAFAITRRPNNNTNIQILEAYTSGDVQRYSLYVGDIGTSATISCWNGSSNASGGPQYLATDGWVALGWYKGAGSVTPRGHKCVLSSGAFTHTNFSSGAQADSSSPGAGGYLQIGLEHNGEIALIAVFTGALADGGDALFERLSHCTVEQILSLGPAALLVLDQDTVGQKLNDLTGGGAKESAITGTSVAAASVPLLSYGAPILPVTRQTAGGAAAAVSPALETDEAPAVGRRKTLAIGAAVETSTAPALGRAKARSVTTAAEADSAPALARSKAKAVTAAAEVDSAPTLGRRKAKALGAAAETDAAPDITAPAGGAVGPASETDAAVALGRAKAQAIAAAAEVDTAPTLGQLKRRAVTFAGETDAAQGVLRVKARAIAPATEIDTAPALARQKARLLGQALEVDSAPLVGTGAATVTFAAITAGHTTGAQRGRASPASTGGISGASQGGARTAGVKP